MTDITWPTGIFPISSIMTPRPNVWGYESSEAKTFTTYEYPGHRWQQQVTLPDLAGDERIETQMFLLELRGQTNRVLLPDFSHRRRGVGGGTPRINGAGQSGRSLSIDGCPVSTVEWLKRGDYFALPNAELFRLTTDVNTNALGQATIAFEPAVRIGPADNDLLEITAPKARFRLFPQSQGWSSIAEPLDGFDVRSGFSIDFIEAYP